MAAKGILEKVGRRVRELREAKGWSQEELGFRSDLHRNYIGGIERGERNVALLNLEKLAKALGVHPRDLFP
ncbi:helix-turn-helix transcriptional regulator [Stieleria sp. ICT_E10.1]|uniref:Anaerobic benzoate catabolism transcriptional regulator n=1 Tax=Stieleria magnilauensis TaxID=2527963 RepID=A0ABX5XVQ1_9BACT|nr:helix-turn-helix transcriptional regulator [Stieleria sedimenti]MCS7466304.1 helix-turn-helix transcriptional regulator [Stieleria sedimenti]QDV85371.1 anaerobic benzoate catabolism transcriptional regulator [Planctomycetes bacterium TBK1r]